MTPAEFSPEFSAWVSSAGARLGHDDTGAVVVTLATGERAFHVRRDADEWTTVAESQRGGEPWHRFRSPSLVVVERLLASEVGSAARSRAGVAGDVVSPFLLDDLPAGARLRRTRGSWFSGGLEEVRVDGVLIGEFGYGPPSRLAHASAVHAARIGAASLTDVIASYLSPDGRPLFTLR